MKFDFSTLITEMLSILLMIGVGVVAKKLKILKEEGEKVLSSLVVNITTPALIIASMAFPMDGEIRWNIFLMIVATVVVVILSCIASHIMLFFRKISEEEKVILRFCTIFGNIGFIGFPICYGLFGNIGLLYASIYSAIHDIFFWSYGVGLMSGSRHKGGIWNNLLNPCMVAIVIGLFFSFSKIELPGFLGQAITSIGEITLPLSMIIVGSSFCNINLKKGDLNGIFGASIIKLILIPFVVAVVLTFFPMDIVLRYVILVLSAVPCAAFTVVLAQNYNRDYIYASKVIMLMTGFSFISLPLMLILAQSLW